MNFTDRDFLCLELLVAFKTNINKVGIHGGITPSAGEESKLKQNGKSYKNQLLDIRMEFNFDDFHK